MPNLTLSIDNQTKQTQNRHTQLVESDALYQRFIDPLTIRFTALHRGSDGRFVTTVTRTCVLSARRRRA
jgi:hypothetical protein